MNAIMAKSKNCPFGVNATIELKSLTTTSDNNDIQRGMFQLTSVPVLSDVVNIFQLNRSVNSKLAIFGLCQYCIE